MDMGLTPGEGTDAFSDAAMTDWFEGYIKTAVSKGIVTGYEDATFRPMDSITREQAMVMVARAMKITEIEITLNDVELSAVLGKYTDGDEVSIYAQNGIGECIKSGVIVGRTSSTLVPLGDITRAEAAVIVERLLKKSDLID